MRTFLAEFQNAVAGGVAGGQPQANAVLDFVAVFDALQQPGVDQGLDIRVEHTAVRTHVVVVVLGIGPVFQLLLVAEVARVRKSRLPAAVHHRGVPSAVVEVQVGAEHVVDVFRRGAGAPQPVQVRRVELAEGGQFLAFVDIVVADAGVDQDPVMAGADQPAMKTEHDPAGLRLELLRRERVAMLVEQFRRHVRNEVGVAGVREDQLLDTVDLVGPQFQHGPASIYQ